MTLLKLKNRITKGYNIKEELIIRKKLETITDWSIEFNQNYENKYDYDLCCFKHTIENNEIGYKKKLIGYIEVEISPDWKTYDIPENWYEISFLKRKCFLWDYNTEQWTKTPKKNYNKTIYLKANKNFTNCFCINIKDIIKKANNSNRNNNTYKGDFLIMNKIDVKWGWDEIVTLIENLINNINTNIN